MMLKNETNSRKVDHDLQRKVPKDATNSGKEDHNLQRKVLNDAANPGKADHDLQRKVLKDASNSREVDLDLVNLTMMLKNTTKLKKSSSQSPKKSPERCWQFKRSQS